MCRIQKHTYLWYIYICTMYIGIHTIREFTSIYCRVHSGVVNMIVWIWGMYFMVSGVWESLELVKFPLHVSLYSPPPPCMYVYYLYTVGTIRMLLHHSCIPCNVYMYLNLYTICDMCYGILQYNPKWNQYRLCILWIVIALHVIM